MKRYMFKNERGLQRPTIDKETGKSMRIAAETMHLPGTNGVWRPNDFYGKIITDTKPLLDRTHTPRGALRAITLERNFVPDKWLYNKKDLGEFDPMASKREIERSKTLKRITRR